MKTVCKVFGIIIFVLVVSTFVFISQSKSNGGKIDMSTPALTTDNFMLLVKEEKYQDARKLLTSDAKKMYSDDDLERFKDFFAKDDIFTLACQENVIIRGKEATEPIVWYGLSSTEKKTVYLQKNFWGHWKISSIV